jgi:uncharacterized protein YbbK (DUF523 family)/uncharacterized protein YbgA (DUF1722 family)
VVERQTVENAPIRLGVSSCLLGNEVRFDGGHKHDRFITDLMGEYFEWVPVCPEVEVGMGTPRPALRLVRDGGDVRMLEIKSGRDHTASMQRFSAKRVRALASLDLCGYILKKDSPSCGMTRLKVYGLKGPAKREGRGLYASALMEAFPNLPVEEEGRLKDSKLRENFIERVFAYRRVRDLFSGRWTRAQVVAFHTVHRLQLMAHSTVAVRELGRLVGELKALSRPAFREQYERGFMAALVLLATRGRNADVLRHAAGHLKQGLDAALRGELADLIHDYRKGLVPLIVPVTLLGHHARRHQVDSLAGQVYLAPHPTEWMLRNHV